METWQSGENFLAACRLVNQVPMDRFPAFLERIITALTKNERTFSGAEESKLMQIMGLSAENLQILIDACTLIFERAAKLSSTASAFSALLGQTGLSAAPVAAFKDVWSLSGPALVTAFKEKSLGVPGCSLLVDVKWHIHLQVAGQSFSQACKPSAVMELSLISQDEGSHGRTVHDEPYGYGTRTGRTGKIREEKETKKHRNLVLELSSDELFGLYEKLEQIQDQLDQLS